jgi:hypothetical protein
MTEPLENDVNQKGCFFRSSLFFLHSPETIFFKRTQVGGAVRRNIAELPKEIVSHVLSESVEDADADIGSRENIVAFILVRPK